MAARKCEICGADLPAGLMEGLCPKCVLKQVMAEPDDSGLENTDASGLAGAPLDAQSAPQAQGTIPAAGESHLGSETLAAPVSEQAGDRIGRYKLLQRLGEGGMGSVWMAEQTEPVRRMVALKVIKPGMDSAEVLARFEAERQALALMDHPNIAKVLDAGATPNGRPYFVMDLVKGIPFIRFCDEQRLSVRERLELFMQVCQAVQHAHQKGIIHRDLKPSNVLVALYDGKPVPKVIDFGVAKATGQRLTERTLFTQLGAVVGTLEYMSPEQAEFNQLDIDTRSDIYSLGVLLYELLTGTTPLTREMLRQGAFEETLRRIREEEPPKPSLRLSTSRERLPAISAQRKLEPEKLTKVVRGELDWIVMCALEKDRNRRYETANGFALDLQRYLNDEPVVAGPPTARYRLRKFVRKHRRAVAVAAGFVVLLTTAAVVSTGLALWAIRERGDKERQRQRAEEKAEAESRAKAEAQTERDRAVRAQEAEEAARMEVQEALIRLEIQEAEKGLSTEQYSVALAHLARVMRRDPSNHVAAEKALAALTYQTPLIPLMVALQNTNIIAWSDAELSPDGLQLLVCSEDSAEVYDALTGQPMRRFFTHASNVLSARFGPGGLQVVTASADQTARVWDVRTGQPVTEPLKHNGYVRSAQFSPDGQRVVTASADQTARVWDARTGQPVTEPLKHNGRVWRAEFSPDSQRVLTASWDKTARVWDAQSGKPLTEPLRHEGAVNSAQFSPDGLRLATASSDNTARVWDTRTGHPIAVLSHTGAVHSAEFSPEGLRILTSSEDGMTRIWDALTGMPLGPPLLHGLGKALAHFSPDGLSLLTAPHASGHARLWDARTGKLLAEIPQGKLSDGYWAAQFSPDGQRLMLVEEIYLQFWELWGTHIRQALALRLRHNASVFCAHFSPDGQRAVTASFDGTARIWDARTGQALTEPLAHSQNVISAQFSPDGQRVVTAGGEIEKMATAGYARVWDARTGQPLIPLLQHTSLVYSAEFSPDGLRVVTASRDTSARVWDSRTGQAITQPLKHNDGLYSAHFSPDGQRVLTASDDHTARIWNAQTGQPLNEPLKHDSAVYSASFSPDGLRVVTASEDKTARIWSAQTGQPLNEPLKHDSAVYSASFSPDGQRVVTASEDKTARIWNAQTGQSVNEPLRHEGVVWSAHFSPDGQRVVTASGDKTARIWNAQTGQPLAQPLQHTGHVFRAEFSPDGHRVVTASEDKTARIWDVPAALTPIPEWLPHLAEAAGGQRFNRLGNLESVPAGEFVKLKQKLASTLGSNVYSRWVRWFFAEPRVRTVSPFSSVTLPEYVQQRIQDGTVESLRGAVSLSPTNALALSRLARRLMPSDPGRNPIEATEAACLSARALGFAPQDAEVATIRAEIAEQIKNLPKP